MTCSRVNRRHYRINNYLTPIRKKLLAIKNDI